MKKIISILFLSAMAVLAMAESAISVEPLLIPEGKQAELVVNFNFETNHTICNYQMELVLPRGVNVVGEDVLLGPCHTGHTGSIKNNVVVVTSMNKVLSGTSGLLLKIPVEASALPLGTTLQGSVVNIKLGQTNETSINLVEVPFKIEIVKDVTVLDENSTSLPVPDQSVDVYVKRTIKAGEWNTICLPFAMSETQVKEAFGNDVQIADFQGCETTYDDDEETVVGIKVNFSDVSAIEANHPYIIKVSEPVSEFSVSGVDINPLEEISVDRDEKRVKVGSKWHYFYNSFVGTYTAETEVPENGLFLNGNKFWYSSGMTKMKAFRAYFDFYDVLTEVVDAANARIVLNFIDDSEPTTIGHIAAESPQAGVLFGLQGRRVSHPEEKGIYIKNGKEVIVK